MSVSAGGQEPKDYYAHKSIHQLLGKDTTDSLIRIKYGGKNVADDQAVLKVDSTLKRMWLGFLGVLHIKDKPVYVHAKDINLASITKGDPEDQKALKVIACKKELSGSVGDIGKVLNKYDYTTKDAVNLELGCHIDPSLMSQNLFPTSYPMQDTSLIDKTLTNYYWAGVNFETGKHDMGLVADRIMNADDPEAAMNACAHELLRTLLENLCKERNWLGGGSDNINLINDDLYGIKKELLNEISQGNNLKTGKKDLERVGKHLLNSENPQKTLQCYSEVLRNRIKIDEQSDTWGLLCSFGGEGNNDSNLVKAAKHGINVTTGKIEDYGKFNKEIKKNYNYEDPHYNFLVDSALRDFKIKRTSVFSIFGNTAQSFDHLRCELYAIDQKAKNAT